MLSVSRRPLFCRSLVRLPDLHDTLMHFSAQEYLDFVAGISTCTLGHANPDLAAAVGDQMNKFHHVSNLYYIPEQVP